MITSPSSAAAPPARLLLATDLSARCDRALDRAAQLAGEWHAELVALNVLDVTASPDQTVAWAVGTDDDYLLNIARQQLAHDLSELNIHATMRIERAGDAATTIRDVAASTDCGLVITGVACHKVFGRFLLGSTVECLAHTLPQHLPVARNRTHGPYQRIVATESSESSRHALLATAGLFPGRQLILYHACQIPLSGISGTISRPILSAISSKVSMRILWLQLNLTPM